MKKSTKWLSNFSFIHFLLVLLIVGNAGAVWGADQIVTLTPSTQTTNVGTSFTVDVDYDVSDGNNALANLNIEVYFDSTKVTYDGYSYFNDGNAGFNSKPETSLVANDTSDGDGDSTTDKKMLLVWASTSSPANWPGVTLPALLATLDFTANINAPAGATNINVVITQANNTYTGIANSTSVTLAVPPGSVTGTVTYTGGGSGNIKLGLFDNADLNGDPDPIITISAPGAFTFPTVEVGDWWIGAFMDIDGGGELAPETGDPMGMTGPVTVISGAEADAGTIQLENTPATAVFTTSALNLTAGTMGGPLTLQFRDIDNNPVNATDDVTIDLSSDSTGTFIFFNEAGTAQLNPAQVTIQAGQSSASFQYSDTKSGTPTITATDTNTTDGLPSVNQQQTINAAGVNVGNSTIVSDLNNVSTDGDSATITVSLEDQFGNPVPNTPVTLASTGSNNIFGNNGASTNAAGSVDITISSTKAEQKSITATAGGQQLGPVQVTFDPGDISSAQSTVGVNSPVSTDDGVATIDISVRDANNNPIPDQTVILITSPVEGVSVITEPGVTPASGDVSGSISSTKAETKTITAKVGTTTVGAVTVTFDPGAINTTNSTVVSDAANVTTDGGTVATITVTLLDVNNNPIPGQAVTLESTGTNNTITPPAADTDADGKATGTIASTKAETKTITAKVGTTVIGTVDVTFDPGDINTTNSTVVSDAANVTTDGGAVATITVTLLDANNNPISGQAVTLESDGTNNTITPPAADTDAAGQTTGTIASTKAETKTITAKVGATVIGAVNVTFDPGAITQFRLDVSKSTLASDGKGTADVTATVMDQNGNDVLTDTGSQFTFNVTNGSYLQVDTTPVTTANGEAKTTITTINGPIPEGQVPFADAVNAVSTDGFTGNPATQSISIVNFSINVDSVGGAATPNTFVDANGVHLVTSGSTPNTATFTGLGGTSGSYNWALNSVGTITSQTADTTTYNAPATLTGAPAKDTLTLTSTKAGDEALIDTIDINVYNPVAVTLPASGAGIVQGDNTKAVVATGGTGTFKFQSSDTAVATVDADTGVITPSTTNTGTFTVEVRDATYGAFGTANGFRAVSDPLTIVAPLVIIDAPTNNAMESSTPPNTFSTTGGSGQVIWSIVTGGGSIDTNGLFTAPSVTAATVVTIRATDSLYNTITADIDITVYPTVAIANPTDGATILPGQDSDTFTVAGGDQTYTWTVTDRLGNTVEQVTAATYTFTAPDTGNFGGEYTIKVSDGKGFDDSFSVKVPVTLTPSALTFTEDTTVNFAVGGANGTGYNWEILSSRTSTAEVTNAAEYGAFANMPSSASTVPDQRFTPADVTAVKAFYVRVTVSGDGDLTAANGLDTIIGGPYTIVPVETYTVTVTDSNGVVLQDINVTVDGNVGVSDVNGEVTFNLPATDGTYLYLVEDANNNAYIPQEVSSNRTAVAVTLEDAGDAFTGTVTSQMGGNLANVDVAALYEDASGVVIAAETVTAADGTGAYTLYVPASSPSATYDILASVDGYRNTLVTAQTPATTVDIAMWPATSVNVVATEGTNTVSMKITATPAFDNSDDNAAANAGTQLQATLIDPNAVATGTLEAMTFDAQDNSYTIVYSALEDFTVQILADTSADRDVDTGTGDAYVLQTVYVHLAGATTGTSATGAAGTTNGGSQGINANSQNALVEVPAGGVVKDAAIAIRQTAKANTSSTSTNGSPDYIYEIVASDLTTGEELTGADINRIEITLPIDLSVIAPGDLENGIFTIYHAVSQAALEAGGGTPVPVANIISTDYIGDGSIGSVTFWVNSLSYFGVGSASTGATLIDSTGDSRCFIATAAFGSPFEAHVTMLRKFRDTYLMPTKAGRAFVNAYYRLSPPMADFIAGHDSLRAAVRVALMPAVGMSYMLLNFGLLQTMLLFSSMLALACMLTVRLGFFTRKEQ